MTIQLILGVIWLFATLGIVYLACLFARKMQSDSVLIGTYTGLVIISAVAASKIIHLFGFDVPGGVLVYSASFLITDILSECYGKKRAKLAVLVGFFAMAIFFVYSYITVLWPHPPYWGNQEAFSTIIGLSARVSVAGLISFIISQTVDINVFHMLKKRDSEKRLWLRNITSTATSQFIDSVIFITIAFAGVFPIFKLILAQYIVKLVVVVCDTPFVYLGRKILGFAPDETNKQ